MALGRLAALAPWTGAIVAPLAWLACQQGLGSLVYADCAKGGPPLGPLLAIGASLACAAAAAVSWRAAPREPGTIRLAARAGAGLGALLAFACLVVSAATLLAPPCAR
jgi:hypothetical protein